MGYAMEQYDAPTDQWIPLISLTQEIVSGGVSLNVYNGLTEPASKDGVWFKTEDEIASSIIIARTPSLAGTWYGDDTVPDRSLGAMSVVVSNNKVYAIGGSTSLNSKFRIRDLITGVWSYGADVPSATSPYYAESIGETIYVLGGTSNNTRIYSIATNTWTYGTTTSVRLTAGLIGGKVGNKLYAMSGVTTGGEYNRHREYDTVTNIWTNKTNIPSGTSGMAGCACGSKCYAFGGTSVTALTRAYDPITNTWALETNMAYPTSYAIAASISDKAYVIGGSSANNFIRVYNVATGEWSRLTDMADGLAEMCACSDGESKLYVLGNYERYRVLSFEDMPYPAGTAVILSGKIFGQFGTRTAKLADIIEVFVEDAWISWSGKLKSYETYVGNGTAWNKIKDAS